MAAEDPGARVRELLGEVAALPHPARLREGGSSAAARGGATERSAP